MKIYYVLLTLIAVSNVSIAQDLQYDRQQNIQEQVFNRADISTRYCMHTTAQAFLANGMRDQKKIVVDLIKVCGNQMKAVYVNFQIPQPELVEPYLEAMAYDELGRISGVKIKQTEPITKAAVPKLVKNKDGHSEYVVTDPKTGQVRRWDAP